MIGSSARPFSVSWYSTRGGTSDVVALHDALLLEGAQAQRQRARADALQRALELAEPRVALGQVANEQQRPLPADDLGGLTDGTRVVHAQHFTN